MRRLLLIICLLCVCICVSAQNQNEFSRQFARFYVHNSDGSQFPMPVDAYFVILENGETYLKISANNPYNAMEFSNYQKYTVLVGSNLYLKLESDEIITLICTKNHAVKDGFVTTNDVVYQNYSDYSYFPIDAVVVEKLMQYEIIKVRGQFKFEVMDGSMQFTPESPLNKTKDAFIEAERSVKNKYKAAQGKKQDQEILKGDPLYGF